MKKLVRKIFVEHLPAGWRLALIRNYFYWGKRDYVRHEVDLFQKLCEPGRAALDIGANEGLYAMYLCRFATNLTCFEPLPWMAGQLREKFSATQNVRVENCALGSKNESAVIKIPVTREKQYDTRSSLVGNFSGQMIDGTEILEIKDVPVSVKRLDDFKLENIGFIKIDVEGFELEVLKGGAETFARNKPNLYIEIEQKHHAGEGIATVFDFILKLGYRGFFEYGKQFLPLEKFDGAKHQPDAGSGAEYCGNFIFVPPNAPALARLGLK